MVLLTRAEGNSITYATYSVKTPYVHEQEECHVEPEEVLPGCVVKMLTYVVT